MLEDSALRGSPESAWRLFFVTLAGFGGATIDKVDFARQLRQAGDFVYHEQSFDLKKHERTPFILLCRAARNNNPFMLAQLKFGL